MKRLDSTIIEYLAKRLTLSPSTVRKNISLLKSRHPKCTSNAAAHIYARANGVSVLRKLDEEDKKSLPGTEISVGVISSKIKTIVRKEKAKINQFVSFDSSDPFIKGHIDEINKAYTYGCFTCVFILGRKIIENLIIEIFRSKFGTTRQAKELYFDFNRKRNRDFSEILDNLFKKRVDFDDDKKIVEQIYNKSKSLKNIFNDKTHSWYHLVTRRREVDDSEIVTAINLIKTLLLRI